MPTWNPLLGSRCFGLFSVSFTFLSNRFGFRLVLFFSLRCDYIDIRAVIRSVSEKTDANQATSATSWLYCSMNILSSFWITYQTIREKPIWIYVLRLLLNRFSRCDRQKYNCVRDVTTDDAGIYCTVLYDRVIWKWTNVDGLMKSRYSNQIIIFLSVFCVSIEYKDMGKYIQLVLSRCPFVIFICFHACPSNNWMSIYLAISIAYFIPYWFSIEFLALTLLYWSNFSFQNKKINIFLLMRERMCAARLSIRKWETGRRRRRRRREAKREKNK